MPWIYSLCVLFRFASEMIALSFWWSYIVAIFGILPRARILLTIFCWKIPWVFVNWNLIAYRKVIIDNSFFEEIPFILLIEMIYNLLFIWYSTLVFHQTIMHFKIFQDAISYSYNSCTLRYYCIWRTVFFFECKIFTLIRVRRALRVLRTVSEKNFTFTTFRNFDNNFMILCIRTRIHFECSAIVPLLSLSLTRDPRTNFNSSTVDLKIVLVFESRPVIFFAFVQFYHTENFDDSSHYEIRIVRKSVWLLYDCIDRIKCCSCCLSKH